MRVTPIAYTALDWNAIEDVTSSEFVSGYSDGVMDADALAEFSGRACYQSWKRPNPVTATSEGYHRNTLAQGHYSIYEHASITFYVEGVSRALTHELIRHRHLSYSQLSQRFVAEDRRDAEPVLPPAVQGDSVAVYWLHDAYDYTMGTYETLVSHLTGKGLSRKQAREAARAVLPNAQETKIVVTGNIRAWRDFLGKRLDPHADAEIRELAEQVLAHLRDFAPHSVQDIA